MAGAGGESPHVALQALGSESTQDEEEPRESGTPHRPFANGSCPTVAPLLSRGFTGWKKKKKNGGRRVRLARGQVGGAIRSQRGADKSCQSLHHSVTDRTISTQVLAIKGISTRMLCVSISICLSWCFSKTPNKKDFSTDKECKFLHDFFFSLGRSLQILSFSPKVSFNVLAIALYRDTVLNLRKLKGIF